MKRFLLLLSMVIAIVAAGSAESTVLYSCYFNSNTMSKGVSAYDASFNNTCDGTTWEIANFNNNNKGWEYIKCGSKKFTSVATIINENAFEKAIDKVSVTIDAITTNSVNSITLYVADNKDFNDAVTYTVNKSKGIQSVVITNPKENLYYKLAFDCKQGSSNGLVQVSKIEYYGQAGRSDLLSANLSFPKQEYIVKLGENFQTPILSKETDGAVTYSSSKPDVATVDVATGAVSVVGVGTTTITATAAETDAYNAGTASYTLTVVNAATSFQDIYDAEGEILVNFPMTVTFVNGGNTYVRYNDTYSLIYKNNLGYEVGDVIPAGWTAKRKFYNGLPEMEPVGDMPAKTENVGFTPEVAAELPGLVDVNKVVVLQGVYFSVATPEGKSSFTGTMPNDADVNFYNQFTLTSEEAGYYNVTVVVGYYEKNLKEIGTNPDNLQYQPISFDAITIPEAPEAMIFVNGELGDDSSEVLLHPVDNADLLLYMPEGEEGSIFYTLDGETKEFTDDEEIAMKPGHVLEYWAVRNGLKSEVKTIKAITELAMVEHSINVENNVATLTLKVPNFGGAKIYYRFIEDNTETPAALRAAEPDAEYIEYPEEGIVINNPGTLHTYAEHANVRSEIKETKISGDMITTGVEDITVENGGEVEYFDLQGRAVANPRGGIFIRRSGNTTVKVAL